MSTGVAGFSRHRHLEELNDPLVTNEGVLSPAQRKARARANLDVDGSTVETSVELTSAGEGITIPVGTSFEAALQIIIDAVDP